MGEPSRGSVGSGSRRIGAAATIRTGYDASNCREASLPFLELSWLGKDAARAQVDEPSPCALIADEARSHRWSATQNVFIEGDNLDGLKLLQAEYSARIKMIYIDPPYNTGNEFTYSDNFRTTPEQSERTSPGSDVVQAAQTHRLQSGHLHAAWLNMMYPRLVLAAQLLRVDGLIFISIGDQEVHNLRHLLDEIFGPTNFVTNFVWRSRTSISNDQPVSANHTHTIVYAKDKRHMVMRGDLLDQSEYKNPDDDPRGPWKPVPLDANKPGGDTQYGIENPETGQVFYPPNGRSWAVNSQRYAELADDGRIAFGLSGRAAPKRKLFLRERLARGDQKTPSSLLLEAGTNKSGTQELMAIFDGKKVFDYPKPTRLLETLIRYGTSGDGENIVLDFFAGSGSVAHAVNHLAQPGTSFICIQAPAPIDKSRPSGRNALVFGLETISALCLERIRRSSPDAGVRVYRIAAQFASGDVS
ncbi:MAG: site-specific DNA-methyltransferase [Bradymonadia bacterium]